jgi:hypothetical protein
MNDDEDMNSGDESDDEDLTERSDSDSDWEHTGKFYTLMQAPALKSLVVR